MVERGGKGSWETMPNGLNTLISLLPSYLCAVCQVSPWVVFLENPSIGKLLDLPLETVSSFSGMGSVWKYLYGLSF